MALETLDFKKITLDYVNIYDATVHYQLSSEELHTITVKNEMGKTASSGALAYIYWEITSRQVYCKR